jgi:hypothetical protein
MGLSSLFDSFYFDDDPLTELVREYPNIFKSEMAVDKAIAELRSETVAALQAYPNTGKRVFLQKNFDRIEEYLRQALKIPKSQKTAKVVLEIMFGGQNFMPPSLIKSELLNPWELISRQTVSRGAKILREIDISVIKFEYEWDQEDMQTWIDFYLLADKNNEAIIVISDC